MRLTFRRFAVLVVVSLTARLSTAEPVADSSVGPTANSQPESSSAQVLVLVDGQPITQGDLDFQMITRRVPEELQPTVRKRFVGELIDKRLIQAYLARQGTSASKIALDAKVERIRKLIRKSGDDPAKILARLGYSEKTLRAELALPLAWKRHIAGIVTRKRLRSYFANHRREFDGTQLRASQILLKVSTGNETDELTTAENKLRRIRTDIIDGKTTFAEAAKQHSQAPSRDKGGDVGFFPYRGKMPVAFTKVAFALKDGEVSQPFRTPFGVHLCTVTARKPGQLSLEDARPLVLRQLSDEIWNETVQTLRAKSKIEWQVKLD